MTDWTKVGASEALEEGGQGIRFLIGSGNEPAFVVRSRGVAHAYLNRCSHVAVELDWPEGVFFDDETRFLQCATHGAIYDPSTGGCQGGPCAGRSLVTLDCLECDGVIWVRKTQQMTENTKLEG